MCVPDGESLLEEHSDRSQSRIASIRRQPARLHASGPRSFRNAIPCCGPSIDYAQVSMGLRRDRVRSRFWPSTVVGKRSYQNTLAVFRDLFRRMSLETIPLIATDGFGF